MRELQDLAPAVMGLSSHYLHFIEMQRALTDAEHERLRALLRYGPRWSPRAVDPALFVLPRFGTISPWSSKATDIVHVCGLDAVDPRGARGRLYAREPRLR